MDCSYDQGNNACGGGLAANAYKYLVTSKLELEADYPYKGVNSKECLYDSAKGVE